jgi:hypothetical protein
MFGKTGPNNPMFGKTGPNSPAFGRTFSHSEETKANLSSAAGFALASPMKKKSKKFRSVFNWYSN